MAVPAATWDSYGTGGTPDPGQFTNREDLADIIWNISPTETPFQMMVARGKATNRLHDWPTDQLAAAGPNAAIEGDDAVNTQQVAVVRLQNYTQISTKEFGVSGTQDVIDKAGRKSELAYLIAKNGKELKRDMEFVLTQNAPAFLGSSVAARTMATLEAWYGTQVTGGPADTTARSAAGTPGADGVLTSGVPLAAATDSTVVRALTETLMKSIIQAVWTNGGDAAVIMCGPFNKTVISAFTGNSTRFDKGEDMKLVTAIDVYVSDFGSHRIVPNRFSRDRTLHILTMHLWSIDYLRAFKQIPIAITGDNTRRELVVEYTLASRNETGSGVVADLTTS